VYAALLYGFPCCSSDAGNWMGARHRPVLASPFADLYVSMHDPVTNRGNGQPVLLGRARFGIETRRVGNDQYRPSPVRADRQPRDR